MNLLNKIRSVEKHEMVRDSEPIDRKDLESLINIISVAKGCEFRLTLLLEVGEFSVDSVNFKGIKILNVSKNEPERVVVSFTDTLSTTDVTIPLEHIVGASLDLHLSQYGEDNVQDNTN